MKPLEYQTKRKYLKNWLNIVVLFQKHILYRIIREATELLYQAPFSTYTGPCRDEHIDQFTASI